MLFSLRIRYVARALQLALIVERRGIALRCVDAQQHAGRARRVVHSSVYVFELDCDHVRIAAVRWRRSDEI